MPILKNQRHEAFAQAIVMKASATDAYLAAGYKVDKSVAGANGHKLLKNAQIVGRIQQLAEKAAARVEISKADVMSMLLENAKMCMGKVPFKLTVPNKETGDLITVEKYERDPSAANQALALIGKELRMFIERKEVGEAGDFDKLDDKALAEALKDALAELGSQGTQH